MFRNMACSLMEHEVIKTTVPKAKELRKVAEPLITLAKKDSVANRRLAFSRTGSKAVVGKLFSQLGPRYQDRAGGYTRILKAGFRAGDAAPVGVAELAAEWHQRTAGDADSESPGGGVELELKEQQLETGTPPCTSPADCHGFNCTNSGRAIIICKLIRVAAV